ncbi:hypothetical protein ACS0TY_018388 [Phlomoides rotata]
MPRPTRVTESAQRPSPRGPPSLRTSSSDSDPPSVRPRIERNPKLSHPPNQKKLGTRIADLESQLGLAQEELKSLKGQLVSTEAVKKSAHDQLEKKPKKQHKVPDIPETPEIEEEKHSTPIDAQTLTTSDDIQQETDVFEVLIDQKETVEPKASVELPAEEDELKRPKSPENPLFGELALKNDEINLLKSNLDEKEKELEAFRQENQSLKIQLDEKTLKMSYAQSEIDELTMQLNKASEELEKSKSRGVDTNVKLEAAEKAKEELEEEMRRLRVQTEQWRKAADAAASVLAGGVETNGRRISERCGSMDKFYGNAIDHVSGYGYVGSPGLIDDSDDVFGSEKRKGIRMFGDLWKRKGQK